MSCSWEIVGVFEQGWIRDFFFSIQTRDFQQRHLSETLTPVDALNQAVNKGKE